MFRRIVVLVILAAAAVTVTAELHSSTSEHIPLFQKFMKDFSKNYTSTEEEHKRFSIFVENLQKAQEMQKKNPYAKFGVNVFSDLSEEEFKVYHNGEKFAKQLMKRREEGKKIVHFTEAQIKATSSAVDWRKKGAVTGIKNQGQCGSCWSFSTTGNIEGQWFLAGNRLTSLSEQNLVSCDTLDDGCNGGMMDNAFKYLIEAQEGEIATEASYPYVSGQGYVPRCQANGKQAGAKISGHVDVAHNENEMATFLAAHGPVSIGVDASQWQPYTGGIVTQCGGRQVDHGVLLVGYDKTNYPAYWIIKNSWGVQWGEEGYIRVEMGSDQCLITATPCSSQVKGGPGPGPTSGPTGQFIQYNCYDFECDSCQKNEYAQNTCLRTEDGGSAIVNCEGDQVQFKTYMSENCEGYAQTSYEPLDQCLESDDGEYIKNECPSGQSIAHHLLHEKAKRLRLRKN